GRGGGRASAGVDRRAVPEWSYGTAVRVGGVAGVACASADGARDGESHLAIPDGDRAGGDSERVRRAWQPAIEREAARLAGDGVRCEGLEREGDRSDDRDVERVSAVGGDRCGEGEG